MATPLRSDIASFPAPPPPPPWWGNNFSCLSVFGPMPVSSPTPFLVPSYHARNPKFSERPILETLNKTYRDLFADTQGNSDVIYLRIALLGGPGIGKTQVALEYVYRLHDTFPQLVIVWIDGIETLMVGTPEQRRKFNPLDRVKAWSQINPDSRWLLVIKNSHDQDRPPLAKEDLSFLPDTHQGAILLITQNKATAENFIAHDGLLFEVNTMSTDESICLFKQYITTDGVDDDKILSEISTHLEGMPDTIVEAAEFIRRTNVSIQDFLQMLERHDQKLASFLAEYAPPGLGPRPRTSRLAAKVWTVSFEYIRLHRNPIPLKILSIMGVFNTHLIPRLFVNNYFQSLKAKHKSQSNETDFEEAIRILLNSGLVTTAENDTGNLTIASRAHLLTRKWLEQEYALSQLTKTALFALESSFPNCNIPSNHETGETYLSLAVDILQISSNSESDNDEKLSKARLSNELGLLYSARGEGYRTSAEPYYNLSFSLHKDVLGEENPDTLTSMSNLAVSYAKQGNLEKAEELGEEVLRIREKVLGEEHPDTLISRHNLASIYLDQKRWTMAMSTQKLVLETRRRVLGVDDPTTISSMLNLATTYRCMGECEDAAEVQKTVLDLVTTKFGEGNHEVVKVMHDLGCIYYMLGEWAAAKSLMRRALEIEESLEGPPSVATVTNVYNLAVTIWKEGVEGREVAEEVMQRGIVMSRSIMGTRESAAVIGRMQKWLYRWGSEFDEVRGNVDEISERLGTLMFRVDENENDDKEVEEESELGTVVIDRGEQTPDEESEGGNPLEFIEWLLDRSDC
ncbi:hypothetical protein QBC38DRAFT_520823 [Podospora fimiseda]|uniref:NB-ARC domain-containing protein n=1 Tax=Podospora fimiseda TaxID=252190 RepID=A0AAN6YML5_9PEZI|nr:hypothetical protein QBC38DRAFT_520823 [Podospora fimiseda]